MNEFAIRNLQIQLSGHDPKRLKLTLVLDEDDHYVDGAGVAVSRKRGHVKIESEAINFIVRGSGDDRFQLLSQLLGNVSSYLKSESRRLGATVFRFEPGDSEGSDGLYRL